MTAHPPTNWEPDPRKMGNWKSMFEPRRQCAPPSVEPSFATGEMASETPPDDDGLALDLSIYRPWILQRGRTRPALMLDFRRYEPRSGMWSGWAIAYPTLVGVEYTADRLVSMDFGKCQVVLEGVGLDDLVRHLQQGSVIAVQEYSQAIWPIRENVPMIRSIAKSDGT